jgi:hypothetical protein
LKLNPYAPPESHARPAANDARDHAELFIDSLPPPVLKGAAIAWFALAALMGFFSVHILVDLRLTPAIGILCGAHVALAAASAGVGIGIFRGRTSLAVVGFGVTPFLLMACTFALFTGALAGLMGLGLVLIGPALTAASLKAIAKVGHARELLASHDEAGGGA